MPPPMTNNTIGGFFIYRTNTIMTNFNTALGFADYDFRASELFYTRAYDIYSLYRSFGALPLRTATVKPTQVLNPNTASAL